MLGRTFQPSVLMVVGFLVVLEALLSADNALVLANKPPTEAPGDNSGRGRPAPGSLGVSPKKLRIPACAVDLDGERRADRGYARRPASWAVL